MAEANRKLPFNGSIFGKRSTVSGKGKQHNKFWHYRNQLGYFFKLLQMVSFLVALVIFPADKGTKSATMQAFCSAAYDICSEWLLEPK